MNIVAVIAEYNPFHNGHKFHIEESKRLSGANNMIAVMSGNFVQRGEPAIFDKLTRATAAVKGGIDAVFELPVRYSTSSSPDFAYAGVEIINSLGGITHLSFGTETPDVDKLQSISDIILKETSSFKSSLNDHLKEGYSFPKARALALEEEIGSDDAAILSSPNNILAIEYLTALKKMNSEIIPIAIPRRGASHDSAIETNPVIYPEMNSYTNADNNINPCAYGYTNINTNMSMNSNIVSAKSIRGLLHDNLDVEAEKYIPFADIFNGKAKLSIKDFEVLINKRLLDLQSKYEDILDLDKDLYNKIKKLSLPMNCDEIITALKSKEITYSRICRVLIHILLEIDNTKNNTGIYCPYTTLLALNKNNSGLLKTINNTDKIKIINKRADYIPENKFAKDLYLLDKKATDLYNLIYYSKTGIKSPKELSSNVSII